MPYFKWFGYTSPGELPKSDAYASESLETLTARLAEEKITLVHAISVKNSRALSIPLPEKVILFEHLGVLLQAHIPLAQALMIVSSMVRHKFAADIMRECGRQVARGVALHEVAAHFPELWDPISYKMLCVGQDGGILAHLFKDRVIQLQGIQQTMSRLRAVLLMPLITAMFLGLVILFLLLWVVPQFKRIFAMLQSEVPLITRIMLSASDWLNGLSFFYTIGFCAVGYMALLVLRKSSYTSTARAWCLLYLPVVNNVYKNMLRAQFLEFTAILLKAGMHASQALLFVSDLFVNPFFKKDVQLIAYKVEIGKTLQQACLESIFMNTPDIIAAVTIGHETGQFSSLLSEMGHRYRTLATTQLDRLVTLAQPLIIIGLGLIIGSIMLALYLPLINVSLVSF